MIQKKVFIKTFGCQMNEYDSNRIYDTVKNIGYIKNENQNDVDCYILNTCHIRDKAKEKVYHEIGRVKKSFKGKKKPIVVVAGCVAQAENEEMLKREPYIDIVIGPQAYHKINDLILNQHKNKKIDETDFDTVTKFNYFDDILGTEIELYNDYTGERLAIKDAKRELEFLEQANKRGVATDDEVHNKVLELTGALGADIHVFTDAVEQNYVVFNNTTGSYTLTFANTGHAANGVALKQGAKTVVYSTGSKILDVMADLGDINVKKFGKEGDYLIKVEQKEKNNSNLIPEIKSKLTDYLNTDVDFRRVENVGPKVSSELLESSIIAISLALTAMLFYIWVRFEWQFSLGSIIALLHDVIITLGIFSVLSLEINLSIIAAVLTIVGYSMNDTVVIYDRIRENLFKYTKISISDIANLSINETLARTIITSVTTLLALSSIYILGGEILRGFSFAMILGVIIGTYSSIFVASPILKFFKVSYKTLEKEEEKIVP